MVYYIPTLRKCDKCGFEVESNNQSKYDPCPKCYEQFLKQHVGNLVRPDKIKDTK